MQSIYSVYGTRIHLMLDDEFAKNYNRAIECLNAAQKTYKDVTGKNWNGETLYVDWTDEMHAAHNDFADLMNLMIKLNGGSLDIKEEDLTSPYLEKV